MFDRVPFKTKVAVIGALVVGVIVIYEFWHSSDEPKSVVGSNTEAATDSQAASTKNVIDLTDSQLAAVQVEPVELREFPVEREAVGSIEFNEDRSVQVFTPYQGRIIALFAQLGDDIKKGQTLFTVDSPDLLQAESTLIAAAGVLQLTSQNLTRLQGLYTTRAVSQHDLEQATSDQQTAEGNLRAARDNVRIFGKSDADIDRIIEDRLTDPTLVVASPIDGRVTARNAAPGLFVQPGNTPAPYTVTDVGTMWMLANVAENDSPAFRVGQDVEVTISAFPGRVFEGKVTTSAPSSTPIRAGNWSGPKSKIRNTNCARACSPISPSPLALRCDLRRFRSTAS